MTAPPATALNGRPLSPPARRPVRSSARDPRLLVGIVLVTLSVVLGARLLAGADDTVPVWALRVPMSAGSTVDADDVVSTRIRFASSADADRYVSAGSSLPPGAVLARDVGAGELLPRAALGEAPGRALVEVPLSVPVEAVPGTVRAGSLVDVWVTPESAGRERQPRSVLVLERVTVVDAPRASTSLGPTATRQVVVGVAPDQEGSLAAALAQTATGVVTLTQRG